MLNMVGVVNPSEWFDDELSEADSVLPVQFHNGRAETATAEPLRRLMVAVLVDAIRSFQTKLKSHLPAGRQQFAEVRSWIFSDDDNGCFSFRGVCEALGIDPKAMRKGLAEWKEMRCACNKSRRIIRRAAPAAKRISVR